MLISEKIKPVAIAIIDFCFSEGISKSVGQSFICLVGWSVG